MFSAAGIAAVVLTSVATVALAQGAPMPMDAAPASRTSASQSGKVPPGDTTTNRGKPTKEQKTAVKPGTPTGDASGNKSFFESRSNTARSPDSAAVTDDAAAQRKINTSKSNLRTGNAPAEAASKPTPAEAAPGSKSGLLK